MKIVKNLVAITTAVVALLSLVALVLVLMGYRPFVLKSASMEPIFTKGSLCWINTKVQYASVDVGDVLVYRSPTNTLVLHRLVDILPSETGTDSLAAVMQGDANDMTQNVDLSRVNFIGREAFTIPHLGAVVERINLSWVFVGVFLILACIPWESVKRKTA